MTRYKTFENSGGESAIALGAHVGALSLINEKIVIGINETKWNGNADSNWGCAKYAVIAQSA
ncbi:MAG: hypothetical protein WCP79_13945 [Bacillota bacterium]